MHTCYKMHAHCLGGFTFYLPLLLLALIYLLRNNIPTYTPAGNDWDGIGPLDGEATLQGSIAADAEMRSKLTVDCMFITVFRQFHK